MELLTIADISRSLGVPDSTVRYYRDRLDANLPYVGSGRSRRYMPEVVDILREIMGAVKAGSSIEEVRNSLPVVDEVAAATVQRVEAATGGTSMGSATATLERPAGPRSDKGAAPTAAPKTTQRERQRSSQKAKQKLRQGRSQSASASPSRAAPASATPATSSVVASPVQIPGLDAKLEEKGAREAVVGNLPGLLKAPASGDFLSCKTVIETEIRELHEEISMMREMIATLLQEQSESLVGERDKQLMEALKGLQSMKAPKRRWFGLRS